MSTEIDTSLSRKAKDTVSDHMSICPLDSNFVHLVRPQGLLEVPPKYSLDNLSIWSKSAFKQASSKAQLKRLQRPSPLKGLLHFTREPLLR